MTVQGKKDLAKITAAQDAARKSAEKSWRAVTWASGHKPRLRQALIQKARSDDRFVAALEKQRRLAEREAFKPDRGWERPRRTAPGLLGTGC